MKGWKLVFVILVLTASLSGCLGSRRTEVTKPSVTKAPSVTAAPTTGDLETQFPDVSTISQDEIVIGEPDFDAEETVDLGSIL